MMEFIIIILATLARVVRCHLVFQSGPFEFLLQKSFRIVAWDRVAGLLSSLFPFRNDLI